MNVKNDKFLKSENCSSGKVECRLSNTEYNQFINKNSLKECYVLLKVDRNEDIETDVCNKTCMNKGQFIICSKCNKKVVKSYYKRHLANHSKTVKCDTCKYFFTEKGFDRHSCERSFRCDPCNKTYRTRYHLETHLRWHSQLEQRKLKPETVSCSECNKPIKRYNIKRHARLHEKNGPILGICSIPKKKYICDICGKDCQHVSHLKKHQRAHLNQSQNKCDQCDASFSTYVQLVRHISQVHLKIEGGLSQCPICQNNYDQIGTHMKTHDNESSQQCPKCPAILPNNTALKSHIRHHIRLAEKSGDRDIVPHNWKTPRTINNAPPKTNTCPLCTLRYDCHDKLIKHLKRHLSFSSYRCPYCKDSDDECFTNMLSLVSHISLVHRWIPQSHVQCHICSQIVPVTLINSHWSAHGNSSLLECEVCDLIFSSTKQYEDHFRLKHSTRARRMNKLQLLLRKYSKPKADFRKVTCLQCGWKTRISHMNSHMKCHQMYRCLCCGKLFSSKSGISRHEAKHTHILSQRCPVCSQSFLSHIRLLAHLKMVHKMSFTASKSCDRCAI